jgi:hypothetical protein
LLLRVHNYLLRVLVRHLCFLLLLVRHFPTAGSASFVAATAGAAFVSTAGSASLVAATAGAVLFAAVSTGALGCYSCSMVCSSLLLVVQYWARDAASAVLFAAASAVAALFAAGAVLIYYLVQQHRWRGCSCIIICRCFCGCSIFCCRSSRRLSPLLACAAAVFGHHQLRLVLLRCTPVGDCTSVVAVQRQLGGIAFACE